MKEHGIKIKLEEFINLIRVNVINKHAKWRWNTKTKFRYLRYILTEEQRFEEDIEAD